jgi:hypothetical protein
MRPRPQWGQGWRKGDERLLELEIRGKGDTLLFLCMPAMNDTCFLDSHILTKNISSRCIKKLIDGAPEGLWLLPPPPPLWLPPKCDRTE